jgi:hypothetical protein
VVTDPTLFAHTEQEIAATVAAMGVFQDTRAGLFCPVAPPVKPEDRIRTAHEALFDL